MDEVELAEWVFLAREIQEIQADLQGIAKLDAIAVARAEAFRMEERMGGCLRIIQRRTVECQEEKRASPSEWRRSTLGLRDA